MYISPAILFSDSYGIHSYILMAIFRDIPRFIQSSEQIFFVCHIRLKHTMKAYYVGLLGWINSGPLSMRSITK